MYAADRTASTLTMPARVDSADRKCIDCKPQRWDDTSHHRGTIVSKMYEIQRRKGGQTYEQTRRNEHQTMYGVGNEK